MKKITCIISVCALMVMSCRKEAGEGGTSSITGKITVRDYKGSFFPGSIYYDDYDAQEEDVYIIYGNDDDTYDNRYRTSFDGTFKFENLRKGMYKIFTYSDDTNLIDPLPGGKVTIVRNVEITKNKSENQVPEILIIKL